MDNKIKSNRIIGAIAGDIIGSIYEWHNIKTTNFNLFSSKCDFTDDTVLTIAIADCIINNKDFAQTVCKYGRLYPGRGYGDRFRNWLLSENPRPYNSYGNGSAMRVSPIGFAYKNISTVSRKAKESAEITHNHYEGIKGAQAVASAIFLADTGNSKAKIKDYITLMFHYNLNQSINNIRANYKFDETCQGSVPQAIIAFLESTSYESAIRLAISIGGDSDTIACITGGIAAAFYKYIPKDIVDFAYSKLPKEFIGIIEDFDKKFPINDNSNNGNVSYINPTPPTTL